MVTTVSRQQANTGGPDCRVSTETSDLLSPVTDSHARVQAQSHSLLSGLLVACAAQPLRAASTWRATPSTVGQSELGDLRVHLPTF